MEAEIATKSWVASFIAEILIETKVASNQDRVMAQIEKIEDNMINEVKKLEMKLSKVSEVQMEVENLRRTVTESSEEARMGFDKFASELDAWKSDVSFQLRLRAIENPISDVTVHVGSDEAALETRPIPMHNDEPLAPYEASNECAQPKGQKPKATTATTMSSGDPDSTADTAFILELSEVALKEIKTNFYKLENSVFDCSIFVFTRSAPLEDSIAILFGVFMSVFIQLTILGHIFRMAMEDTSTWQEEAWHWRLEHAHHKQYLFDAQNVSLAQAICDSHTVPFAVNEQSRLHNIETYKEQFLGVPQGLSMVMSVLVIWLCGIVHEICKSVKMTLALGSIAREAGAGLKLMKGENGTFSIGALGNKRKSWALLLCTMRLWVGFMLCVIGCLWLVHTLQIEELLLNALALTFIVEIDESAARLIVTDEITWMIEHMKPLRGPHWVSHRNRFINFMVPGFSYIVGFFLWFYFLIDTCYHSSTIWMMFIICFVVGSRTSSLR